MAEEQKTNNFINNSLILAALISVAGLIATRSVPLQGERPQASIAQLHQSILAQNIDARLWQDPFSAVAGANTDETDLDTCHDQGKAVNHFCKPTVQLALEAADERHQNAGPPRGLTTLWVTMSGAPYFGDEEQRRRFRYAVISALHARGFAPSDETHLGYFSDKDLLQDRYPFELFGESLSQNNKAKRKVLVVWVDEDLLRDHPREQLAKLAKKIGWPTAVIGPQTSSTLKDLSKALNSSEFKNCHSQTGPSTPFDCIPFYAYGATIAEDKIDAKQQGSNVFRTIITDDKVAEALRDELERRGVNPCKEPHQLIVTISELDTLYGRNLSPSVIDAIYKDCFNLKTQQVPDLRPLHMSYFRGIDGESAEKKSQKPAKERAAAADAKDKDAGKSESDDKNDEKPFGLSQRDYLRRLALDLKRRQEKLKQPIAAIGVLGSDVFDKLMILRALRPEFPNALFFTTDYDAALGLKNETEFTRNVIVASSFGPELSPELQRDIPPFRDGYETSVFLATQMAVASALAEKPDQPPTDETGVALIRVATKLDADSSREPSHPRATLTASGEQKAGTNPLTDPNAIERALRPRVFEVMRTGGLLELPQHANAGRPEANDQKTLQPVQPEPEALYPAGLNWLFAPVTVGLIYFGASIWNFRRQDKMPGIYASILIMLLFFALILSVYSVAFFSASRLFTVFFGLPAFFALVIAAWSLLDSRGRETYRAFLLMFWPVIACCFSLIAFLSATHWNPMIAEFLTEHGDGEPMALLGGVSVWPAIALRFFALLSSIWLILLAFYQLEENFDKLCREFGLVETQWNSLDIINKYRAKHPLKPSWLNFSNFYRIAKAENNVFKLSPEEWEIIVLNSWTPHRIARILIFWTPIAIAVIGGLFSSFGSPIDHVRSGEPMVRCFYDAVTSLNVIAMWFLIFLVVDATLFLCLFVWRLSHSETDWPDVTRRKYIGNLGLPESLNGKFGKVLDDWTDVQFILERTKCINMLVWYPFAVMSFMIVSRSGLFANFPLSWPIIIAQCLGLLLIFTCAFALNWFAEDQRKRTERCLRDAIIRTSSSSPDLGNLAKKLECMLDRVTNLNEGSFRNFLQQPVFTGMLLPLASVGGPQIIEQTHLFGLG